MTVQSHPVAWAVLLVGMVVVWFVLINRLCNRLESAHPEKYQAMGRPGLFLRQSLESDWHLFKFLFAREHRKLGDDYLSKLSDVMLAWFITHLLIFGAFCILVMTSPQAA